MQIIFIRVVLTSHLYPGILISAMTSAIKSCTVFKGTTRLASGSLAEVAVALKEVPQDVLLQVFDDATGRPIDIDTRGTTEEIITRLLPIPSEDEEASEPRGRGRPKLGVVAREITLLPRHWDWLNSQPGGASVALRKLVEEARRASGDRDRIRCAQEAAYHFMSAIAGNLPGFEEAARALFAYDRRRFGDLIAAWPEDIRDHVIKLAFADLDPAES